MQKIENTPHRQTSQEHRADLTIVLKRARLALIRFVGLDFILSGLLGMSLALCLLMGVTLVVGLPLQMPYQGWVLV